MALRQLRQEYDSDLARVQRRARNMEEKAWDAHDERLCTEWERDEKDRLLRQFDHDAATLHAEMLGATARSCCFHRKYLFQAVSK